MAGIQNAFMIAPASPDSSGELVEAVKAHIEQDDEASLHKERPSFVVAGLSDDAKNRLQQKFGNDLIIEPDSNLIL